MKQSLVGKKVKPTKSVIGFYIDNAHSLTTSMSGMVEDQFDNIMEFALGAILFPTELYGVVERGGNEGCWKINWYLDGDCVMSAYYEEGRDFELVA